MSLPFADPALDDLLRGALRRLEAELAAQTPFLAGRVAAWLRALAAGAAPEAYFLNPIGFPLLRLPWWLAEALAARDPEFQADLVFSSVNGYYFIRLLDNVMDGHAAAGERELLPAAALFHTGFQAPYQRWFPAGHPFWTDFQREWFGAAEAAARDASLPEVDAAAFQQWAARKVSAAKIPLAAVAHHAGRPEQLAAWAGFVDAYGAWHQMWNDVFDWSKDLRLGTRTYFLTEAGRRRQPDETPAAWVARTGFAWGVAELEAGLARARGLAEALGSPALLAYLDARGAMLRQSRAALAPGLEALAKLAVAMK
ncbi:MAG: hypothetical protein JNK29_14340 [Anaerolineales bacterium]|nr:hypothetical protein [Anaerolineales bacterium]